MDVLQFSLIALAIFYLVIAFVSIFRIYKVTRNRSAIKISISFYLGMFLASIARAICFILISLHLVPEVTSEEIGQTIIYILLVIPDNLNICVYLFLAWYFFANFIQSHINLANDLGLFLDKGILVI